MLTFKTCRITTLEDGEHLTRIRVLGDEVSPSLVGVARVSDDHPREGPWVRPVRRTLGSFEGTCHGDEGHEGEDDRQHPGADPLVPPLAIAPAQHPLEVSVLEVDRGTLALEQFAHVRHPLPPSRDGTTHDPGATTIGSWMPARRARAPRRLH